MMSRTDEQLLQAWRAGDEAAGSELFERYFDPIYRFFRNKAQAAAEDLAQQTFLACLSNIEAFRAEASFRTYLFTIARSKLYDHLRGALREEPLDFEKISIEDFAPSPSRNLAQHQDEKLVEEALSRLPVELQIAVELFYFEEMPASDVASVLGVPEGTVRSRVRRALEQLREQVQKLGPTEAAATRTLQGLDALTRRRAL